MKAKENDSVTRKGSKVQSQLNLSSYVEACNDISIVERGGIASSVFFFFQLIRNLKYYSDSNLIITLLLDQLYRSPTHRGYT